MSDSSSDDDFNAAMNILFNSSDDEVEDNNFPKKKPKRWVRGYYLERDKSGACNSILNELRQDSLMFFKYTRMTYSVFEELLAMVGPLIQKQVVVREPLSPTLRYLATGESQTSLSIADKCSQTSVHRILNETTECITVALRVKVFPKLTTDYYKSIAAGFEDRWNFPICIGAIDGKYITIQAPNNSGSEFFNYKKTSSIVLMAICDHHYKFTMCNISAAGRQSDGGVFRESHYGKRFYENNLPIPEPRNVTDAFTNVPYVLVADHAFALGERMLKPYTTYQTTKQKIFNYRLSRARRMIENCFGILSAKWRIFRTPIVADLALVEKMVQSCVCLHNWLRDKSSKYITPDLVNREVRGIIVPGSWNDHQSSLLPLHSMNKNSSNQAKLMRDKFADYFSGEGQVEWQLHKI